MQINYPLRISKKGSIQTVVNEEQHIRQLIEQVLFTAQSERVNRPNFGCGINQLVFAPNSDALATATQVLVQGSLQQWLGEIIRTESVEIKNEDSILRVTVQYVIIRNQKRQISAFTRSV